MRLSGKGAGKLSYRNGSRGLVPQYCLLLVILIVISQSAYQFDKGREHSTQVCGSAFRLIVLARRDDPRIGYFQSLLGIRKRHCAMPDQNPAISTLFRAPRFRDG